MLCKQLASVLASFVPEHGRCIEPEFADWLLERGAETAEPSKVFDAADMLAAFHLGKDDCIHHMLGGGNGFPLTPEQVRAAYGFDQLNVTVYDAGTVNERRDMRSMTVWQRDLVQALSDRKRGRIDG